MNIQSKLLLGFVGTALLVSVVGCISLVTSHSILRATGHLRANAITQRQKAAEMFLRLTSTHDGAQRALIERYRAAFEPDEEQLAQRAIKAAREVSEEEAGKFTAAAAQSREVAVQAVQLADARGNAAESVKEKEMLVIIEQLEKDFAVYDDYLKQHFELVGNDLSRADEFKEQTLQPYYELKLLPAVRRYEAMVIEDLAAEAETIENALDGENKMMAAVTAGALFAALFVGAALANSISRRIRAVKDAAVNIGSGESAISIAADSTDEIGALATAFNQMAHNITERAASLEKANEQLQIELGERRRVDAALRESERRYRELFENANDIVFTMDLNGNFTSINRQGEQLSGYTRNEILGGSMTRIVAPEYIDQMLRKLQDKKHSDVATVYEVEITVRDGRRTPLEVSSRSICENGKLIGVQGIARDITERRQAQAAIQKSEEYRNLFQHANDAIIVFAANDEIVLDVNDKACELYGFARAEFIGRSLTGISENMAHGTAQLETLLTEKTLPAFESTHFRADGKPLQLLISAALIEYQGQPAVLSINRDITERKQVESRLARALNERANIMEALHDVLFALDGTGRMFRWNKKLETVTGFSPEEFGRMTAYELIHEEDREAVVDGIKTAFATGYTEIEGRLMNKRGESALYLWNAVPLTDETGRIIGVVGTGRDITERKRAEDARQHSLSLLTSTLESTADGLLVVDTADRIVAYNQKFLDMWQLPTNDIRFLSNAETMPQVFDQLENLDEFFEANKRFQTDSGAVTNDTLKFKDGRIYERYSQPQILNGAVVGRVFSFRNVTERKQAEAALLASQSKFKDLFDNAPVGYHELDRTGRIVHINRTELEMLDYTAEEMIGHYVWEFVTDPASRETVLAKLTGNLQLAPFERTFRRRDGSLLSVLLKESHIYDENNILVGLRTTVQDITERKQAEAALRESEERFRNLVETLPAIVYEAEPQPPYSPTYLSRKAEELGYPLEDWFDRSDIWINLVHPDDRERVARATELAKTNGGDSEYEYRVVTRGGEVRWLYDKGRFILDEERKPLRWQGVMLDVTDRKRAEETLEKERKFLEAVLDNLADGLVACDATGELTLFNRAAQEFHGLPAEPLTPEHWAQYYDLYQADGKTPLEKTQIPLFRALQGEKVVNATMVIAPKNKKPHTLIANGQAIFDAGGNKIGAVVGMHDITERNQAERDLRVYERRFSEVVESLSEGLLITDFEDRVLYVNSRFTELTGYARDEAIGQPAYKLLLPPEQWAGMLNRNRERQLGTAERYELEITRRDGSRFWSETNATAYRNSEGEVIGTIGAMFDITERKQAERALRESETRFRSFMDNSPAVAFIKDEAGRFVFLNETMLRIFNFSAADIIGKNDVEVFPAEVARRVTENDRLVFSANQPLELIETVATPDGINREWLSIKFPIIDADQNRFIGCVAVDITERKQAEKELRESRQMLDLVMNSIPQAVFWKDCDSTFLGCNQVFAARFGYQSPMDVVGLSDYDLGCKPEEALFFRDCDQQVIESGEPQYHIVESQQLPNGSETWLDTNKVPLRDAENNIIGILGTFEDITPRKQAEAERVRLEEQLRQAQKMESIGTLAGGVAHDFNNLLTVITGNVQLAARKLSVESPIAKRLAEVETAAARAAALTSQLLAFSRRQQLERKIVDVNDVVRDTMKMLRRLIGEDIEIRVRESFDLAPVNADPQQLEQVVMNLVVNARDAMPDGGRLLVETRNAALDEAYCRQRSYAKPGEYVLIEITDSGTGMDAETRARIFEPFFTTKAIGKGTGLGLSVVYGIVKQHGGYIEVYSEPGNGTSFKVYLPAEQSAEEPEAETFKPILRGGSETVLVVEDEPSLRALASDILEDLGYRVLLAEDGEHAIEIYNQHRQEVDLVLMDMIMPRRRGPEAYREMRALGYDAPVIFVTGYSSETVQHLFDKQNGNGTGELIPLLLQKPYSADALACRVREVLDSKASG